MRVFGLPPRENWVVDRLVQEWNEGNPDIRANSPVDADIIWMMADWCWNHVPPTLLHQKKVVCTVWHIVPEKFDATAAREFVARDRFVDYYHAPSLKSKEQLESLNLATKPIIHALPWVNQHLWFPIDKSESRAQLGLDPNAFIIGSFQRDTEGHDLKSPKLEKGPDRFCSIVEEIQELSKHMKEMSEVQVLLGAWRRQYVMGRLDEAGIKYKFLDRPNDETLNVMYNALDLYIVASRYEGGPQAVVECAASRTPVISTDVGLASEILDRSDIIEFPDRFIPSIEVMSGKTNVDYAYDQVRKLFIPESFSSFRSIFEKIGG